MRRARLRVVCCIAKCERRLFSLVGRLRLVVIHTLDGRNVQRSFPVLPIFSSPAWTPGSTISHPCPSVEVIPLLKGGKARRDPSRRPESGHPPLSDGLCKWFPGRLGGARGSSPSVSDWGCRRGTRHCWAQDELLDARLPTPRLHVALDEDSLSCMSSADWGIGSVAYWDRAGAFRRRWTRSRRALRGRERK